MVLGLFAVLSARGGQRGQMGSRTRPQPVDGSEDDSVTEQDPNPLPPDSELSALQKTQREIWTFLEKADHSAAARMWSIFMTLVILVSVFSFCFASLPYCEYDVVDGKSTRFTPNSREFRRCNEVDESQQPWATMEVCCIMVFTVEYLLRLVSCPMSDDPKQRGPCRFVFKVINLIDLIAIAPWYVSTFSSLETGSATSLLRILRLIRVTRVLRMSRRFTGFLVLGKTLVASSAPMAILVCVVFMVSVLFATLVWFIETSPDPNCSYCGYNAEEKAFFRADGDYQHFESIPSAIWFTIVTMTTVGYGDQWPITLTGKLIVSWLMFVGLVVLALPITIVSQNFDTYYSDMIRKEAAEKKLKFIARKKRDTQGSAVTAVPPPAPAGSSNKVAPETMTSLVNDSNGVPASPRNSGRIVDLEHIKDVDDVFYQIAEMVEESNKQLQEANKKCIQEGDKRLVQDVTNIISQSSLQYGDVAAGKLR